MLKNINKNIIVFMFSLCSSLLFGQSEKEVNRLFKMAENHFSVGNYVSAYPLLKQLEEASTKKSAVRYMLAITEMKYKSNYAASINLFEAIKINYTQDDYPVELHNLLGYSYHVEYQFDSAIKSYKKYRTLIGKEENILKVINRKIETSKNAQRFFKSPENYELKNLWVRVNSSWSDYAPVISADETSLIFTSKRGSGMNSEPDFEGDYYSDLYIAKKNRANEWDYARLMDRKVNSNYGDVSSCLTSDGQNLYLYQTNKSNKDGSIYKTNLNGRSWTKPEFIGKGVGDIKFNQNVSISSDEQTLYFISENKSGSGGKDIYRSIKTKDGNWGEAENLGVKVNSEYDEESPFIHPDGKTLFFSSKGHNTMGGYDVFKTEFNGKEWSEPKNMGFPLNSTKDDLHFVLSANGQNGYFSSFRKDGSGKEDIYIVKMPDSNIPLTMIRGKILCSDLLKPLNVIIKVRDVETNEFIRHVYKPNPETGKYLIILPPGKNYDMIISTEGYIPYKMNVFIPEQKEFYELYQIIYLKTIEVDGEKLSQGISVDNSFFKEDGTISDLDEEYRKEQKRQLELQDLLNNIINTSDSLSLNNMDEVVATNFEEKIKTLNIDTTFDVLLGFLDQVFENTDSIALKHANNIIERGFYSYAEENTYSLNSSGNQDTLLISSSNFDFEGDKDQSKEKEFGTLKREEHKDLSLLGLVDSKYLKNVLFDYKKWTFGSSYHQKLNALIKLYKASENNRITITGHTDNIGSKAYNEKLSKKRVESVKAYLLKKGIPKDKILADWKGELDPVKSNNSEKQRAKNRRVEIKLSQIK